MTTHTEVREEAEGEPTTGVQRDAAHNIAQRGTDEDGEQDVGGNETEVPPRPPQWIVNVTTDFMGHAAQHERPEQEEEREGEPGEGGGQARKNRHETRQ